MDKFSFLFTYWLRALVRVKFKLCVLAYLCLHGTAPPYLADYLYPSRLLMATAVTSGLLTLKLWWLGLPDARRSATVRFPWQLHVLGTVFHQPPGMHHHCCRS